MRSTSHVAGAHRTAEVDFACRTCRHRTTLSIAVEAVVYNPSTLLASMGGPQWLEQRAEREAERRLAFARAMARCPRCRTRGNPATHAWLVASVIIIGLTVGLIGAIPGLMAAIYLDVSPLAGALLGVLAIAVPAAGTTYWRRITNVERWTRFADLG